MRATCKLVPVALVVTAVAATAAASASATSLEPFVFAVTTDYETSGNCARIDLESPWEGETNLEPVCTDPVVRYFHDGRLYVVNRLFCDNIQVIDAETFETIIEFSVGAGRNPHDIVVIDPNRAYVSCYDSHLLLEVNPSTGAILDEIDLAGFADADGLPEMDGMIRVGDRLYVQIQRLDRDLYWNPVPPSYLAVIDIATNSVVDVDPDTGGTQGIVLTGLNPQWQMTAETRHDTGPRIYVAEVGSWGQLDGGIDVVELDGSVSATGFVTTEAELGGDILGFALTPYGFGYALVQPDWSTSLLVRFDLATGEKLEDVYSTDAIADIEIDPASFQLFVAERTITAPGVHVFDSRTGEKLTDTPINTGLPPVDLVVVRAEPIDVADDEPGGAAPEALALAAPNPFRESTRIRFQAPSGGPATVSIYDASGRMIRRLARELPMSPAPRSVVWDGRGNGGRIVPPGVYGYRIDVGGQVLTGRVVLVR